jgi:hypothetical protein
MANTPEAVIQQIETNWKTFLSLSERVGGSRTSNVKNLLTYFETRLASAPCTARKEFHGAYLGGLVEHALKTASTIGTLKKAYSFEISMDSLILVSLFHALGRVGSLDKDLYSPQESDWHTKQGIKFELNREVPYIAISHRSIFLLQHFGVTLSQDEFTAILLSDEMNGEIDVQKYTYHEPPLALVLQQASRFATMQLKNKDSVIG